MASTSKRYHALLLSGIPVSECVQPVGAMVAPQFPRKEASMNQRVIFGEDGPVIAEIRDELLKLWNALPGVATVRGWTAGREVKLRDRIRDEHWSRNWKESFKHFPLKCFIGHGKFKPNIEWFLREDTLTKILEGVYDWERDDKKPTSRKSIDELLGDDET